MKVRNLRNIGEIKTGYHSDGECVLCDISIACFAPRPTIIHGILVKKLLVKTIEVIPKERGCGGRSALGGALI